MSEDLDALRRAVASVTAPEPLDPAVDAEQVFAAVAGELPPEEARALLARATSDATVGFYVRTALATLAEDVDDTVAALGAPPANRPWLAVLVAVAAVMLVSVLAQVPTASQDTLRAVEVGQELSVVTMQLHPERPVLRWVPLPEAQAYRVMVQSEDLTPLYSVRVTRAELRLPDGVLPEEGVVLVQVVAEMASGVPVSGPPRSVALP